MAWQVQHTRAGATAGPDEARLLQVPGGAGLVGVGDGGGGDQPADAPPPVEAGRQGLGLAGSVGPGEGGRGGGQAHGLTAVVERGPSRRRAIPMGGDAA